VLKRRRWAFASISILILLLVLVMLALNRVHHADTQTAQPRDAKLDLNASGYGRLMVRTVNGQKVFYPDQSLTPGALAPDRTTNIVCDPDFRTSDVRRDSSALKRRVYEAYGLQPNVAPCPCEVDHWLPLEDEGVDGSETENPTENLWPEPYAEPFGARNKDRVESWLRRQVCTGTIKRVKILDVMVHWPEIYDALQSGQDPLKALQEAGVVEPEVAGE
jgi:hypothetical protein